MGCPSDHAPNVELVSIFDRDGRIFWILGLEGDAIVFSVDDQPLADEFTLVHRDHNAVVLCRSGFVDDHYVTRVDVHVAHAVPCGSQHEGRWWIENYQLIQERSLLRGRGTHSESGRSKAPSIETSPTETHDRSGKGVS